MSGAIPARVMASFMLTLPMTAAFRSRRLPPKAPIAVLHAETITTSFIVDSFALILRNSGIEEFRN